MGQRQRMSNEEKTEKKRIAEEERIAAEKEESTAPVGADTTVTATIVDTDNTAAAAVPSTNSETGAIVEDNSAPAEGTVVTDDTTIVDDNNDEDENGEAPEESEDDTAARLVQLTNSMLHVAIWGNGNCRLRQSVKMTRILEELRKDQVETNRIVARTEGDANKIIECIKLTKIDKYNRPISDETKRKAIRRVRVEQ